LDQLLLKKNSTEKNFQKRLEQLLLKKNSTEKNFQKRLEIILDFIELLKKISKKDWR